MQREVRDALANILGECSVHMSRHGPEAGAAFGRIREWVLAAVAPTVCRGTHSRGLLTMGDSGAACLGDGCGVRDEKKPGTAGRGAA